jgi:hypothetical protein
LKTERTGRKLYRTRDDAKSDVFDYIERLEPGTGQTGAIPAQKYQGYSTTSKIDWRDFGVNHRLTSNTCSSPKAIIAPCK